MKRLAALFSISFFLIPASLCFSDSSNITRMAVLESVTSPSYGLLKPTDFSEEKTSAGEAIYKAQLFKENTVMAGIIGPKDNIKHIALVVGLSDSNAIQAMLMYADCATTAIPEWKGITEWVIENITSLAGQNGGRITKTVGQKSILLQVTKPSTLLMAISIVKDE